MRSGLVHRMRQTVVMTINDLSRTPVPVPKSETTSAARGKVVVSDNQGFRDVFAILIEDTADGRVSVCLWKVSVNPKWDSILEPAPKLAGIRDIRFYLNQEQFSMLAEYSGPPPSVKYQLVLS